MKRPLLKAVILYCCISSFAVTANGQTNALDKKLDQITEQANNGQLDKAEKKLEKLLEDNPQYGAGWDLLATIRYKQYENAKDLGFSITAKDSDGKELTSAQDSLSQQLAAVLKNISPRKMYFDKYLYTMRKATLHTRDAYNSAALLRMHTIDIDVDSNISKKALKYFSDAEDEYRNHNYNKAAQWYNRALEEQPGFYKAGMYLGDCYYFTGNYGDAVTAFRNAVQKYPTMLEPRKYLTDALAKMNLYEKALDEAELSTTVYPDYVMFQKMEDAAYLNGQRINIKWTPREVFPNNIENKNGKLVTYTSDDTAAEGMWGIYKAAFEKIKPFCDENGVIVKENELTNAKYMEVYCWEQMLKKSQDPLLEEARRMQQSNYLDCYVLVSCFHYDLYSQYVAFAKENRDRIVAYYKAFTSAR